MRGSRKRAASSLGQRLRLCKSYVQGALCALCLVHFKRGLVCKTCCCLGIVKFIMLSRLAATPKDGQREYGTCSLLAALWSCSTYRSFKADPCSIYICKYTCWEERLSCTRGPQYYVQLPSCCRLKPLLLNPGVLDRRKCHRSAFVQ
eukprot:604661-Pelagomonas_calceolata.AAC.1